MKQLIYNIIASVMFLLGGSYQMNAQQKLSKASQSLDVDKDVTINLETDYTIVKIDTWNKSSIEVEAFVESDKLSREELQSLLEQWNVNVSGSKDQVSISSKGNQSPWDIGHAMDANTIIALQDLEFELAEMPPLPPMPPMPDLSHIAEMPELPKMPNLPELPEGITSVNFDYDAYKAEGEAYLESWSKTYQKKYGKAFQEEMKAWAKAFSTSGFEDYEKQMAAWGEQFGTQFGAQFGENYGKEMEAWGESFGRSFEKQMEAQEQEHAEASRMKAEEARHRAEQGRSMLDRGPNIKKTIIIHMPKKANLKVNVKYGELQFVSLIENLKAQMSHTSFKAHTIDGSQTAIDVAYAPVTIEHWNQGQLRLKYVDYAKINTVNQLMLNSVSSNIQLGALTGNASINGSFGDFKISEITESFQNLNMVLENSEALISLPKIAYNLQYNGKQTLFTHPDKAASQPSSTFTTGDLSSGKSIIVNAKFSNILME